MSPLTYVKIGGAAALLATTALIADSNGANRVIARQAKVLQHAQDSMRAATVKLNGVQDKLAAAEAGRRETVREIYREVPTIIDRPVYRTVCGDNDGVRILARARAAANGNGGSDPAAPASDSTGNPPQR